MEYKVLYRKYRPVDFENIVDQKYTVEILKNSIKNNKISHAYIFSGPRGTGKTTTAKVFAKSINCENFSDKGPCGTCENCKNFHFSPDIIEIDAASNNGVDEIRELINNVKIAPTNSKYKVYIIDEVHMLSQSAFNALLLTLEEPPKHIVFILATTNIESVPVTILSRCQRFDFKRISVSEIINRLKYISSMEKIDIDQSALEEIAYLADGGMRDALSILDQLASINNKITLDDVLTHFGSVSTKKIVELINAIKNSKPKIILDIINNFRQSTVEYKNVIKKILDQLYKDAINSKINPDYDGLDYDTLKNVAFELIDCMNKVNINVDAFMMIELILLKYVNNSNKIEEKLVLVENAEQQSSKTIDVKEKLTREDNLIKNKLNSNIKTIRINNCFVNAQKSFLKQVKNNWSLFIKNLKSNKKLYSIIIDSDVVAASDKYIIITVDIHDTAELLNKSADELMKYYNDRFLTNYKVVALSIDEWNVEKNKYIQNIKNKLKYEYLEETEDLQSAESTNSLEKLANNIFDKEKIEMK